MLRCVTLSLLVVAFVGTPARAQLDPELKTPYLWRIVLKVQPHPLLSASFRERVKRDVAAALQPALTPLGTVEVVDLAELPRGTWDPLWQQFDDKGFAALEASMDLTGTKTHFVVVEYRDGRYHLQTRQHDGFTGLASALVRSQSVLPPELVGRTAGLMLYPDFGLVGTIEATTSAKEELTVAVRGGQLGPLDRFVKVGDVFAVSQVFKTNRPAPPVARTSTGRIIAAPAGSVPPPGLTAKPRAFTLLRVIEVGSNGTLRCGVLTRYQNAVPVIPTVVGYRCLKLGTIEAPVTVRLETSDPAYQRSVGLVTVRASEHGFATAAEARDLFTFKDGLFRSARPISNVACVTVSLGPTQTKLFPVPVLGPEPVSLPFEINPRLEEEAANMRAVLAAAARVADARNAQTICFEATAELIKKEKNNDALQRARGGFQAAEAAGRSIADDLTRIREQPEKHPDAARLLASIDGQLLALKQFNVQLAEHVKTLEEVVRRENDPTIAAREVQAESIVTRIALLLGRGDVDEAINAYDQLVTLLPDNAEVKARREKLKADWATKGPEHAKARDYMLMTWPAVASIPDFRDSLPQITAAVDECMKQGDRYALRKLLTVFTAAGVKLNNLVTPLDPNAEADRKLAADANTVGETLAALEAKITEFVKKE